MPLIGAHISIAKGLDQALKEAQKLNCQAIQIFLGSNRSWKITPPSPQQINTFKTVRKQIPSIQYIMAHNSYLINISSPNPTLYQKSIHYFIQQYQISQALGLDALVTHPGSYPNRDQHLKKAIQKTAKAIDTVLKACPSSKTKLLIENTAGQGNQIGFKLSHLEAILNESQYPEKIFFCIDTQHAFAAGYDIVNEYETFWQEVKKTIGLKKIKAFHLNDSQKPFHCQVDRHANIGKGHIPLSFFQTLLQDKRFRKIPMCLETNPGKNYSNYKHELQILHQFIH